MNFKKEIQQLVLPLVKGAPVILTLIVLGILAMHRVIRYLPPLYQANGAIKINNLNYTSSTFDLFENGMAVHGQNENFLTEVEVFKSTDLPNPPLPGFDSGN